MGKSFKFIFSVFLLCSLWGQGLWANIDFSTTIGGRNYPKSGFVEAELGVSSILWGNFKEGSSQPWYGFVRGFIEPSFSVSYDALKLGLEVFPVSILGFRYHTKRSANHKDLEAYDCVTYDCRFKMEAETIEADLVLGYGKVFLGGRMGHRKLSELEKENATQAIVEPVYGLAWVPNQDEELNYLSSFVGYRLSDRWQVLGLYTIADIDRTGAESQFGYLFVNHNIGDFAIGAGAGAFKSPLKPEEFSAVFNLRWEPLKSPVLF